MKKIVWVAFILGIIGLSSFSAEPSNYEEITFDYFVSDILKSDFKDVTAIEFKGKTEDTYSSLGKYKVCVKPAEKLQSYLENLTKGSRNNVKDIRYEQTEGLVITDFQKNSTAPKLYIYPALLVADDVYVFLALQMPGDSAIAKYIFKLNREGKNIYSCKMG